MMSAVGPLREPRFLRLFAAQVIALLGTGLSTVALALVAYDIAGGQAGAVLGTALAIKMVAYVGVAPIAAALTARVDRKKVLIHADLVRAGVAIILPFVDQSWQIYILVFVLQSASATFTPAFQAVIPTVLPDECSYTRALSLSRLAYDLESVLSPVVAAVLLTVVTYHSLFVGTALGFLGSMLLVLTTAIPRVRVETGVSFTARATQGVREFGRHADLRGLAATNVVAAAVTGYVVVDTVVVARVVLGGSEWTPALLLGCFGAGSMVVALAVPRLLACMSDRTLMSAGCVAATAVLALMPVAVGVGTTGATGWISFGGLWVVAGAAASSIGTPSLRVVRRAAEGRDTAPLFTAQFSLSHACFLLTYPIAGWLGAWVGLAGAAIALTAVATLGTISAAMLWTSPGGGRDGRTPVSPPELRTFDRT